MNPLCGLLAAFFSLSLLIWCILTGKLGWGQLAKQYHCDDSFTGSWKGWQTGRIGWISYRRCLWVGIASEGLYLKTGPLSLFKAFAPPLCIPWSAIKIVEERKYLWSSILEVRLNDPDLTIMFYYNKHLLDEARCFLGDKFIPLETL